MEVRYLSINYIASNKIVFDQKINRFDPLIYLIGGFLFLVLGSVGVFLLIPQAKNSNYLLTSLLLLGVSGGSVIVTIVLTQFMGAYFRDVNSVPRFLEQIAVATILPIIIVLTSLNFLGISQVLLFSGTILFLYIQGLFFLYNSYYINNAESSKFIEKIENHVKIHYEMKVPLVGGKMSYTNLFELTLPLQERLDFLLVRNHKRNLLFDETKIVSAQEIKVSPENSRFDLYLLLRNDASKAYSEGVLLSKDLGKSDLEKIQNMIDKFIHYKFLEKEKVGSHASFYYDRIILNNPQPE